MRASRALLTVGLLGAACGGQIDGDEGATTLGFSNSPTSGTTPGGLSPGGAVGACCFSTS